MIKISIVATALLCANLFANDTSFDESLEDLLNMKTELKADVGSRNGSRNFLDARFPTDVITAEQIERSGLTSLTDVLRYNVAGFNAPETSVADGSDHVRAFTLRGMAPDQVLVLINGKRLHTSALLHVNGTIGRGSSGVDLDTIAVKSIEKIEILRDGAAAQYGSDAIAGVINIILKGYGYSNSVTVHGGQRAKGDGLQTFVDTFISAPLDYDGFVNLTLLAKNQNKTQRAGLDRRGAELNRNTHVGIADSKNFNAVLNVELPLIDDTLLYANAIFNKRDSKASAFFRQATNNGANAIYPNGFLPIINAKINDYSLVVGVIREFSGWIWDLSNVYGANDLEYRVDNSYNYSLALSPTSFYNGSLEFKQNTTNLDIKRGFNNIQIAVGAEYRYENYEIQAGEAASYINGALGGASGSQGFAGYRPENEVDATRNSYAIYFDAIYNINDDLNLEGAARFEDFSDFGTTSNYKLAFDYKVISQLMLRSSLSTGFRAPSLSQSNYSQISSFVDTNGVLEKQGTFRPSNIVSQALGASDLKPEESKHFTIGAVYQPTNDTYFMIDFFTTKVNDRIMLSDELSGSSVEQIALLDSKGVQKARFFTNAVYTKTDGVDFKFNTVHEFNADSYLDFGFWFNYNKNEITSFDGVTVTKENSFEQIDRVENGQPKTSLKILTHYAVSKYDLTLNLNRFGSYSQARSGTSYKFDASWTTDLDVSYTLNNGIKVALGGANIFDVTPNKWKGLSGELYGYDGIKPYSRYSPFGYSGAYYYIRATAEF